MTDRSAGLLCAALSIFLVACNASESPGPADNIKREKLVLTGSSTVAPLAAEIARRFEAERPGVRIDVQTGGSSKGIHDARDGLADIGMASRALKAGEEDLFAHTIALDGICMILHRDNPVEQLTRERVVSIYRGDITNWREVGGKDRPIVVVNKAQGRSTLELFLDHFDLDPRDVQASIIIGDNEQGVKTVAGNPDAIGYVSIGTAEYDAEHGAPIKLLPLEGVAPSVASVRSGAFPLSRPLNFVTPSEPEGLEEEFIAFARSSAVSDIVQGLYFVPVQ